MINYKEAVTLAQKIKSLSPVVQGVELFGSTLVKGQGRDADFMILVDKSISKNWWQTERELIRMRWPNWLYGQRWIIKKFANFLYDSVGQERKGKRFRVSLDILGISIDQFKDDSGNVPNFELFLVPIDWHIGKEVNLSLMSEITDLVNDKNTMGFLGRVAKDVAKVA